MADRKSRKELMFDLDTKKLSEFFGESKYRNCYSLLQRSLEKQGFEHEQGSVYNSKKRLTNIDIYKIIQEITKQNPWLKAATKRMQVGDVPILRDLTGTIVETEIEKTEDFNLSIP